MDERGSCAHFPPFVCFYLLHWRERPLIFEHLLPQPFQCNPVQKSSSNSCKHKDFRSITALSPGEYSRKLEV
ncbi:unnamed protein product [Haemonchus placei]|uniref:Ovule protein n=1 Tax=Haemonchus placei TaxID=6290 RepID=A0A0N4WC01_HAEPC|nr:unnamed protein product [Haemonchus placei]